MDVCNEIAGEALRIGRCRVATSCVTDIQACFDPGPDASDEATIGSMARSPNQLELFILSIGEVPCYQQ